MPQEDWQKFEWYHSIELGNGVVTEGHYDLRPHLPAYGFPDDMTGMRVLDVGRASGFFSFEFERRGASPIIATELASPRDWDIQGGVKLETIARIDAFERMEGAFHFAHQLFNSKVVPVPASVYDLSPGLFNGDLFDIVFAGSIMSHVKNPVGALEALLSVTKGSLIVAAPTNPKEAGTRAMFLVNTPLSWWRLTDSCLTAILKAAGASRSTIISHFAPHNRRLGHPVHHTVVHAFKG